METELQIGQHQRCKYVMKEVRMEKIDFVLTWVDGNDPAWLEERKQYQLSIGEDGSEVRYRDWDNLQYWFRGVEKFAPWVNKIYFVTWGHVPSWLQTDHPKLQIIKHEEFLKKDYLPTFNINSIELNLHRIRGLSEQFVFFNDDTFLLSPVEPEDFFKNGFPRDYCVETALAQDNIENPFAYILMNDAALVNMHFKKKDVLRKQWKKWFHPAYGTMALRNLLMLPYKDFSSFKYSHLPSAFLKASYEKVWEAEGDRLDTLCRNRFRTMFDVNQYVIKYWQYMEGNFEPQSPGIGQFCILGRDDDVVPELIENQKKKMICINDSSMINDFEKKKKEIQHSFLQILPDKSSFEI